MTTNNVFFLNNANNESAIRVAAVSLLRSPIEVTEDAQVNVALVDGNLKREAYDMVANVIDMGTIYNVIHKDARLAQAICDVLFEEFIKEAGNTGIDIEKLLATKAPQKQMTLEEIVTMHDIQEVVIKGVPLTEKKVVSMMGAAGLVIGGRCGTKLGEATIVGFEATASGVFAVVVVDGQNEPRRLMAEKVTAIGHAPVAASSDDAFIQAELAKLSGATETAAKAAVGEAIMAGGMTIRNAEEELSEAERFEVEEQARIANREKWLEERTKNGKEAAQSDAAKKILEMANKLQPGGGASQPAKAPQQPANNGQATRRPQPNQNQSKGENKPMANTNTQAKKDQPKQGVAGNNQATRRPEQQQAQAPKQQAGKTTLRRPGAGVQSNNGGTGSRARLGAGAPVVGGNRRNVGTGGGTATAANVGGNRIALRHDTPMAAFGSQGAWYLNHYENVLSGEAFEMDRANLALGITGAKFYDAHAYAEARGFQARETDLAILVLEFGPALSFQFNMKVSNNPDSKTPWYISNVSFVRNKTGNGGRWTYVVGRRKDDAVLIEKKGEWVMADAKEIAKASEEQLWTVKGAGWVNDTIYGMHMGEEIIAQVYRWASFGWDAMQTPIEADYTVVE